MLAVVVAVMDQAVGQADRVAVVLVALINLTLAQTELPILAVVEEGEEHLQVEATVALELLYLVIQLLIDLPQQLQDHLHLLLQAETTFTLLTRLERLLFKEQI